MPDHSWDFVGHKQILVSDDQLLFAALQLETLRKHFFMLQIQSISFILICSHSCFFLIWYFSYKKCFSTSINYMFTKVKTWCREDHSGHQRETGIQEDQRKKNLNIHAPDPEIMKSKTRDCRGGLMHPMVQQRCKGVFFKFPDFSLIKLRFP